MHIYLSYKAIICLGQDRDFTCHVDYSSVYLLAMGRVQSSTPFPASFLAAGRRESMSFCAAKLAWSHRSFLISLFALRGKQLSMGLLGCQVTSPSGLCICDNHHSGRNAVMI